MALDAATLRRIAPQPRSFADQTRILDAIVPVMDATFSAADIGIRRCDRRISWLRSAMNPGGSRLLVEQGDGWQYEGNANLGNTQDGDGPRYLGRGLIQLTGRYNYTHFSRPDLDIVDHPELAAEPVNSLRLACAFWNDRQLSPLADCDDVLAITARVNGAFNGYELRCGYLARARIGVRAAGALGDRARRCPTLRQGDSGTAVMRMQARLRGSAMRWALTAGSGRTPGLSWRAFRPIAAWRRTAWRGRRPGRG